MTPSAIALSRFGYGFAARDAAGSNAGPDSGLKAAQTRLLRQLDLFDPSPAPVARRAAIKSKTGETINLIRSARRDVRANSAMADDGAMPAPMTGAMPEAVTPDDARAAAREALPPEYREKLAEGRRLVVDDVALRANLAISSPAPMMERMVHFWANHFSVSVGKPGTQFEVGHHEFAAIRPRVLGRFGDLLKAAVLHPAMLLYLDQFQSVGPNSPFQSRGNRRANPQAPRGLNENLAREILELHTLGVGGGYDQTDVTELARALTGWTVPGLGRVGRFAKDQASGAAFVALAHEPGARRVLGRAYPAGEETQALAILDDLAAHPATARHIATKLARHFAGDTPPAALVARLETDFLRSGGDLSSLTRTLIAAPEAWTPDPVKFRTPFEWFIAAARLTGAAALEPRRIVGALTQLGQVPWRASSPAGYDDLAGSWAGPDALFRRVELAQQIARDTPIDGVIARAQAAFPGTLSEATATQLARAESGRQALALLLVSPEMLRR